MGVWVKDEVWLGVAAAVGVVEGVRVLVLDIVDAAVPVCVPVEKGVVGRAVPVPVAVPVCVPVCVRAVSYTHLTLPTIYSV